MLPRNCPLQIDPLIELVREEFNADPSGESLLPTLAIYSVWQCLTEENARYKNKCLVARYTDPRRKQPSIGIIEIMEDAHKPIEVVVVRNRETITSQIIQSALRESNRFPIRRYYFLTTAEPLVIQREQKDVHDIIREMQTKYNCEIIIDGVLPTLKYYLRAISAPTLFWQKYCDNQKSVPLSALDPKKTLLKQWHFLMEQMTASD